MNTPLISSLFALTNFLKSGSPTPTQRKHIFHLVITICFLITLLFSKPLWTSSRDFPMAPIWGNNWIFPLPSQAIFYLLIGMASLSLLIPRRDITTGFTAILCFGAMMEDINRVHPWMLYFSIAFLALSISKQRDRQFLRTFRVLTICIYFWSGFHKWNINFIEEVWPYMLEGLLGSSTSVSWVGNLAYIIPIIEAGLAIGLFFPRFRKVSISGLVLMHLFILIVLGPLGRNWNMVVWPWNLAMLCNLLFLFARDIDWKPKFIPPSNLFLSIIITLFGVFPILHTFYIWPGYLSWSIYTKQQSSLIVTFNDENVDCLPAPIQTKVYAEPTKKFYLLDWSSATLKTPHFPHSIVYRQVVDNLCEKCPANNHLTFIIRERVWGKWKSEILECPNQKNLQ